MLDQILEDRLERSPASNEPIIQDGFDYDRLIVDSKAVAAEWGRLSKEKQIEIRDLASFHASKGLRDLKDPTLLPCRNLSIVKAEVKIRSESPEALMMLGVDSSDLDNSLIELAESLENIIDIRDIYRMRKLNTGSSKNAGISADEAKRLKNCFSQGRELFLAGQRGSLVVKPLNFFYALTAYAYGAIVLNNPIVYRKDMIPGSHGLSYLPNTVQVRFGGDSARGTFSDLVTSFPTQLVRSGQISFHMDCTDSLIRFYNERFTVSLGTLISMLPEMGDYYKLTTNQEGRCFPLKISTASDVRTLAWDFHIGDGETRPSILGISQEFPDFPLTERHGKFIITVPSQKLLSIRSCIFTDIRGGLWYIDNPFHPVVLPEIAVHFLVTCLFSNIMRYRPDEWGSVLSNEVRSPISLISRHYFSLLQRKFMMIVLRATSRYFPFASSPL